MPEIAAVAREAGALIDDNVHYLKSDSGTGFSMHSTNSRITDPLPEDFETSEFYLKNADEM